MEKLKRLFLKLKGIGKISKPFLVNVYDKTRIIITKIKLFIKKLWNIIESIGKKIKPVLHKINKNLINILSKVEQAYKKANKKNKYVEPIVVITTSCLAVLFMIIVIKNFTTVEDIDITSNSAEYLYYENKLTEAVEEYKNMQEDDSWPIWTIRMADIYSLQGDFEKSNTLLREALILRDKAIKEEGFDKYKDIDSELITSMLFTFLLNDEIDDVLSFGQQYMYTYGENADILDMFYLCYIRYNISFRAETLLSRYPMDENSSYDNAKIAYMYMLIEKWDSGLEHLNTAWKLNKNNMKIYNVIDSMCKIDKEAFIAELERKIEETNEDSYKVFLAKVYSLEKETVTKAVNMVKELEENNSESIVTDLINYEIYNTSENKKIAVEYLEKAKEKIQGKDEEKYEYYYLSALQNLANGKYEEALVNAKKSINSNENNSDTFAILIPEILAGQKKYAEVEVYYRTALKKEPFNYVTINNLAEYYSNYVGNNDIARNYYDLAVMYKKDRDTIYEKLAYLDIEDENYESAIENIEKCIDIKEDEDKYYRILGALYFQIEEYEKGIEMTRKAYSLDEKDPITLNNAAWYYLTIEKDLMRSYENIKSAYLDMGIGITDNNKKILIENYNSIKRAYDNYNKNNSQEFQILTVKLIF